MTKQPKCMSITLKFGACGWCLAAVTPTTYECHSTDLSDTPLKSSSSYVCP